METSFTRITMILYPILTGNLKLDGGAMFGVVPKTLWSTLYPADELNRCNFSMRCLLVQDGHRNILIDSGIGHKEGEKFADLYGLNGDDTLDRSLALHGLSVADITDVIHTHLHFDHCGGSTRYDASGALQVTFPNAVFHVSRSHWELANHPHRKERPSFLKENILPIAESGRLHLVEEEGELFPGIEVRFFNGHTRGQMLPLIRAGSRTVFYCGDLVPMAAQVQVPYIMGYDSEPLVTLEEKERFFTEAAEKEYVLFFEHDIFHECATIQKTGNRFSVKEYLSIKEVL